MTFDTKKLKEAIDAAGLSLEDLASMIARPGLQPLSALRNWTRGKMSPAPKPEDVRNMARALGIAPNRIVRFDASHRWARISPRKARLVTDMIQGVDIDVALSALRFSPKRAAVFVRGALDAAIASAEENDADITQLVVCEARVDEGPTIKRFQPKDRGRAHQILKRTSHIMVALEERPSS